MFDPDKSVLRNPTLNDMSNMETVVIQYFQSSTNSFSGD